MKTILQQCSSCKQKHALCYMVRKGGKREIGVLCDFQPVIRHTRGSVTVVDHTKFVAIEFAEGKQPTDAELEGIPEHYTPEARKEASAKGNYGFALMFMQPGEVRDERPLNLPRAEAPATPEPIETDEVKAARLQNEINQCAQAQKELTTQIEGLARRRTQLENQERDLRKELRTVHTMPLKLE